MSNRLIPWCLAATGFLAALTVFAWQGKLGGAAQAVQLPAAAEHRLRPSAAVPDGFWPSPTQTASEAPDHMPEPLSLPLPPATQPEPDPNLQPLLDDQPTVEDLPARRSLPESPEE